MIIMSRQTTVICAVITILCYSEMMFVSVILCSYIHIYPSLFFFVCHYYLTFSRKHALSTLFVSTSRSIVERLFIVCFKTQKFSWSFGVCDCYFLTFVDALTPHCHFCFGCAAAVVW